MCYILSEHFTGIFLVLCMIRYEPYNSGIGAYATPSNGSEEIKKIFSLSHSTESLLKGATESGIISEGGLINLTHSEIKTSIKDAMINKSISIVNNVSHDKSLEKNQEASQSKNNKNISHNSIEVSTGKTLPPATKLTDTASNLYLGVPEVVHINGTSSIKPRKGVHMNKIVPRKGVDMENESSHDFLEIEGCYQSSESECYNVSGMHVECSCCKDGSTAGRIDKQQFRVSCKTCKPINTPPPEKCENICCKSVIHDIYSESKSPQGVSSNYLNYQTVTSSSQKPWGNKQMGKFVPEEKQNQKTVANASQNASSTGTKNASRLKPSVTKVPYDVEVLTELLSKSQQKIFVPIVVSVFLLPLIGILIFFLWRRTKEYWDKRYYKRMDFLIDGIYND